jgi:uncharacterized protein DUF3159
MSPSARRPDPDSAASLREILGGRGGAVDASAPAVAFAAAFVVADALRSPHAVAWGGGVAVLAAALVGALRLRQGRRLRAVLVGLLGVVGAAAVALYTGRAVDYFLGQIALNAASTVAWVLSILLRWPLLGVVVGAALGQGARWRRDPDLLRGYRRASWVWVGQYVLRLAVFLPLYAAGSVWALGIARVAMTWPLVALCVVASWPVLRSALPPGHPGVRHPRVPHAGDRPPQSECPHEA